MNDVRWWKKNAHGGQQPGRKTDKPMPDVSKSEDVVGPTEEEVPDVAHDDTRDLHDEPTVVTDQPDPNDPDLPADVADR